MFDGHESVPIAANDIKHSFTIGSCFPFTENGLLSYENPNYHLDPARLDDALNSNTDEIYEELYQELDDICNLGVKGQLSSSAGRKTYASLDIGTMGVDINTGPVTHIDSSNYTDNRR